MLVVEDDLATCNALRWILARCGCEVRVTGTIAEAIAALSSQPDFVILDLMLPDGNGVEILRRLGRGDAQIRVIVTTGVSDSGSLKDVQRFSPVSLLQKPVDLQEMLRVMGLHMG